jgi:hypothetical protein
MVLHSALTGANLHEPKGVSTATAGQIYIANGAGSGAWTSPSLTTVAPEITATSTEITRNNDVSTRSIAAGGTLTLTEATHEGKTILLNTLTGSVVTLPAATQVGMRFKFLVSVLATSNSHIVKVANASDILQGSIAIADQDTAGTVTAWVTGATDDTVTLNRTTTGSVTRGEWIEVECVATNVWSVRGQLTNTGVAVTPFSATV